MKKMRSSSLLLFVLSLVTVAKSMVTPATDCGQVFVCTNKW
jgi:hypothetical protein